MFHIGNDWDQLLQLEKYTALEERIDFEYKVNTIFPERDNLFAALLMTSYVDTRVVILGQDPYIGKGQANGLAFSVKSGVALPASLKNIFKRIDKNRTDGDLSSWAKQGVLLLNTCLTVREGQSDSHKNIVPIGWESFTDDIIALLDRKTQPVVFMLWGKNAAKKAKLITNKSHLILTTSHPSPLSSYRGFDSCDHFNEANAFLKNNNFYPINW